MISFISHPGLLHKTHQKLLYQYNHYYLCDHNNIWLKSSCYDLSQKVSDYIFIAALTRSYGLTGKHVKHVCENNEMISSEARWSIHQMWGWTRPVFLVNILSVLFPRWWGLTTFNVLKMDGSAWEYTIVTLQRWITCTKWFFISTCTDVSCNVWRLINTHCKDASRLSSYITVSVLSIFVV